MPLFVARGRRSVASPELAAGHEQSEDLAEGPAAEVGDRAFVIERLERLPGGGLGRLPREPKRTMAIDLAHFVLSGAEGSLRPSMAQPTLKPTNRRSYACSVLASSITTRVFLFVAVVVCIGGCEGCAALCPVGDTGHTQYYFEDEHVGDLDWDYGGPWPASNISWGSYSIIVWVDPRPSSEMIEFYDGSRRLDITGAYRHDISNRYGCNHTGVVYDLSALPAGEYLLVHRRSSAPRGRVLGGRYVWETYEGEDALVMTLEMNGGLPDAGVPDAGL